VSRFYSEYTSTMSGVDVMMRLLVITLGLMLIPGVYGCYVNDCNCMNDKVICETRDQPTPIFTESERLLVRYIYITVVQKAWIKESCGLFSRLEGLMMIDDTACPRDTCVPCR
jgi:hypothetical protein